MINLCTNIVIDPIEQLIARALADPTPEHIQAVIDAEVVASGLWVGFDKANEYWNRMFAEIYH